MTPDVRIRAVQAAEIVRLRAALLGFVRRHGERRITERAIRWLQHVDGAKLRSPGTVMLLALALRRDRAPVPDARPLIGLFAAGDYGLSASFLVVHRRARGSGIGRTLLKTALRLLGRLYGRIALDNAASLAVAQAAGLIPVRRTFTPKGAPAVVVAGGDWTEEEVRQCARSVF